MCTHSDQTYIYINKHSHTQQQNAAYAAVKHLTTTVIDPLKLYGVVRTPDIIDKTDSTELANKQKQEQWSFTTMEAKQQNRLELKGDLSLSVKQQI